MKRPKISLLAVFVLLFTLGTEPVQASQTGASATVLAFQNSLIELMKKAESLSVSERYDMLEPAVSEAFHLRLMSQIATGMYWAEATHTEQQDLTKAFKRMSISTLATLFDGYSGEYFHHIGEKPGPQKTQLVITEIVKSDKSTVNISYITRKFSNDWKIIDVIVDAGISELKVRRSEYHQILKTSGISSLIEILNNKADQLISQ